MQGFLVLGQIPWGRPKTLRLPDPTDGRAGHRAPPVRKQGFKGEVHKKLILNFLCTSPLKPLFQFWRAGPPKLTCGKAIGFSWFVCSTGFVKERDFLKKTEDKITSSKWRTYYFAVTYAVFGNRNYFSMSILWVLVWAGGEWQNRWCGGGMSLGIILPRCKIGIKTLIFVFPK